jgi:hypothetical protein
MSYEEKVVTRTGEADVTRVQPTVVPPPVAPAGPAYPEPAVPVAPAAVRSSEYVAERRVERRVSGGETAKRAIVLLFALIQGLIVIRIVLLLLGARPANDLVAAVYSITDLLVDPFRGILSTNRIDTFGTSILDVAAIVALIGWTIIELVVLGILRVVRREPTPI